MLWPVYIRLQWEVTSVYCVAVIADRNSYGRRFRLDHPYWVHPQWSHRGHVQSCHLCTLTMCVFICVWHLCSCNVYFVTFATVLDYCMCLNFRYVVVLNGKETIHEAFVKHSLEFSDRLEYYTNTKGLNIHAKGKCRFNVLFVLMWKLPHFYGSIYNLQKSLLFCH